MNLINIVRLFVIIWLQKRLRYIQTVLTDVIPVLVP